MLNQADELRHIVSTGTGATTTLMGGAVASTSVDLVQSIVGIAGVCIGVIFTIASAKWRYREHKQRMKILNRRESDGD